MLLRLRHNTHNITNTKPAKLMKKKPLAKVIKRVAKKLVRKKGTINWNKELDNPPARYSPRWSKLVNAASKWPTCACGTKCTKIARNSQGAPMDSTLIGLGIMFAGDVNSADWRSARRTLERIEFRTATILAEMKEGVAE